MNETEKQSNIALINGCLITVEVLLWGASILSILGLAAGSATLSNTLLPSNIFAYEGWLCYVFGVFGVVGFLFGIFAAVHGVFTTDVKTYEVSSKGVSRTADGCLMQLIGLFVTPMICAFIAYALTYYLFWGVLEAGAYLLPYLIGLLLVTGAVAYIVVMWRRRKIMKWNMLMSVSVFCLLFYAVMAYFFTASVSLDKGMEQITDTVGSFSKASPKPFILTKDGVGSLVMKKPFKDMSDSNEGLYNKVKIEPFYDEPSGITFQCYTLYWDEVEVACFKVTKASSPIECLTVTSPHVSLSNGIKVGMPVREVLKKGIRAEASADVLYESECGYSVSMSFQGIDLNTYYGWSTSDFTEQGMAKMRPLTDDSKFVELTAEDFSDTAVIPCFYVDQRSF